MRRRALSIGLPLIIFVGLILFFVRFPQESPPKLQEGELASQPGLYVHSNPAFALRYPEGFVINEKYVYSRLGPGKEIPGVSFTIPREMTEGTNLSADSYMSVEWRDGTGCSVATFLEGAENQQTIIDADAAYLVGMKTGAGAGNRYEEIIYLPDQGGCTAVRYFIHTTSIENYPPGTTRAHDRFLLLSVLDGLRRSLAHEGALE